VIGRISDFDLRLLRIFREVVEAGGFAVATAKLNVAESTISQHMTDLEKRLGVRLCERGRSGFRLTDVGQDVYQATVDMLGDLDRFRDRLHDVSAHVSGRIALGLPDAIISYDEAPLLSGLKRFAEAAPGIHVHLEMLTPRELERGLIENRLHAAVTPEHRQIAGLDYQPLFAERNLLYCGSGHRLYDIEDDAVSDALLENERRINRGYYDGFDASFFTRDHYAATVYQTEAAAMLILTGAFIGFLPQHYARRWVEEGRMKAVAPERYSFSSQFCLVTRKERQGDSRLRTLARALSA